MTELLLKFRNRHFFVLDLIAFAVVPSLALALRLDAIGALPPYVHALLVYTLMAMVVRVLVFWWTGLYDRYWRYASVDEIALIVSTVAATTAINTLLFFALRLHPLSPSPPLPFSLSPQLPRSIPFIDGLLALMAVGGSRFSLRLAEEWHQRSRLGGQRILIIGAGDAGRLIAREIQSNPQLELEPVGFVDDDPAKQGMKIQGLPVLGDRECISKLAHDYQVRQAIIAMPTAPGKTIRHFFDLCKQAGIEAKTIPGIYELLSGRVSISQIRNVEIEDLLRREPIEIEASDVARMVRGKRVLVTGAGGSIGLEICRQVAQHGAAELVLLGHGENSIFRAMRDLQRMEGGEWKGENGEWKMENGKWKMEGEEGIGEQGKKETSEQGEKGKRGKGEGKGEEGIGERGEKGHQETREQGNKGISGEGGQDPSLRLRSGQASDFESPLSIVPVIADVRDLPRLKAIFDQHRPHIVFHAAAHKHVLLMEYNVQEAVSNNVLGTKCLIEAAEQASVERFVLISTDKAVNPCSVMGATKRVAEKLVEAAASRTGQGFVAVRFGNVLGSRGSVVNIFREQIARGGPVTVTHPDMRRYFMTIPEAVQLVLQAAAIGRGGEIFVLDMGEPVLIEGLAHDLIRLSGLEVGRDIDVEFIGRRRGEKLFEELFADGEVYCRTHHEKIFVCRNGLVQEEREKGNKGIREKREQGNKGEGKWTMEGGEWKMEEGKGKMEGGEWKEEGKGEMEGGEGMGEGGVAGLYDGLERRVDGLIAAAEWGEASEVRCLLQQLVPEYQPTTEWGSMGAREMVG